MTNDLKTAVKAPKHEPEVSGHMSVNVGYGPMNDTFDVPAGSTVEQALANPFIKEMVGYKGGAGETVVVNGLAAAGDRVLRAGDRVEIVKKAGDKA